VKLPRGTALRSCTAKTSPARTRPQHPHHRDGAAKGRSAHSPNRSTSSERGVTRPETPSTMRTISGTAPRGGMKSMTRIPRSRVSHSVSSTSDTSRYRRLGSPPRRRHEPAAVLAGARAAPQTRRRSQSAGSNTSRSSPGGGRAPPSAGRTETRNPQSVGSSTHSPSADPGAVATGAEASTTASFIDAWTRRRDRPEGNSAGRHECHAF
jgi:hypothetical protein